MGSVGTYMSLILLWIMLSSRINNAVALQSELSWEKVLLKDLELMYQNGSRAARPVLNTSTTVRMKLRLGLIKLDLNEREKLLTLSTWTRYVWQDEYLRWNRSVYGGVGTVRMEPEVIWMPDVELYNTGDVRTEHRKVKCVVHSNGLVTYYTLAIYRTSCALNLANYPFDTQHCSLWFGSWTHDSRELDISARSALDLSQFNEDYKETAAWNIMNTTLEKIYDPAKNMTPNFAVLIFRLTLQRKVVFSTYLLTLPCVFLACLTLVVFWLPPGRADRTTLAMSTFGSFMLELLILVEAAPPTAASVPLLGVYYCFNIVIIVVAVILSTIVINVSEGLPGHVPACIMRLITSPFGKVLLLRDPPRYHSRKVHKSAKQLAENASLIKDEQKDLQVDTTNSSNGFGPSPFTCSECVQTRQTLCKMNKEISYLKAALSSSDVPGKRGDYTMSAEEYRKRSWKVFGLLLDRIFFIMYLVLIILSLIFMFPRPA